MTNAVAQISAPGNACRKVIGRTVDHRKISANTNVFSTNVTSTLAMPKPTLRCNPNNEPAAIVEASTDVASRPRPPTTTNRSARRFRNKKLGWSAFGTR